MYITCSRQPSLISSIPTKTLSFGYVTNSRSRSGGIIADVIYECSLAVSVNSSDISDDNNESEISNENSNENDSNDHNDSNENNDNDSNENDTENSLVAEREPVTGIENEMSTDSNSGNT
jgi:hypothetical protein